MSKEAKQNAIKEAYGEYFEMCKPDKDGWSSKHFPLTLDIEFGEDSASEFFRPKSLAGIEDNNGWIKIESEEDLPKERGLCFIIRNDKITKATYYGNDRWGLDGSEFSKTSKIANITHYQQITEPKPPIY